MKFHVRKAFAALLAAVLLCAYLSPAQAEQTALNILIIGVDSSPEGKRGRSDAMMLAQVDAESGSVRIASFLRDLYVSIPGAGSTRLNAAYYYGGEKLLKETLEKHFDLRIDRTVTVRFSTLIDVIDQLGGVEMEISPKELSHFNDIVMDYNRSYSLSGGTVKEAGTHLLNGKQALCYSRIRKIDSDFQRVSRQQRMIAAMLDRISALPKWDLLGLALKTISKLDTDLSLRDVMGLMPMAARLKTLDFQTVTVPFEGAFTEETVNGMMVLKPDLPTCKRRLKTFFSP
ncbi:MAG: LCP family protein [bacterium]|nr:LCP family protein [bacterium]